MKIKELLHLVGIWRPKTKTYGSKVTSSIIPGYGEIKFAQWLHPKQGTVQISKSVIDELKKYLDDGDVAIDIGAHTGDSTIPLALACGKNGMAFAFEPNRYVFPVLEENVKLNAHLCNIIPLNFAATEQDGKMEFEYSDEGFCNGGLHKGINVLSHGHVFKLEVDGKNLQSFLNINFKNKIDCIKFIKTDCEGYDFYVIQTLVDIIDKNRPFLKIEVHKNTSKEYRLDLFRMLTDKGYTIYKCISDNNLKGDVVTEKNINDEKHFDIFCENTQR